MADEPKPKNPERYWKRERIYRQHPAVKDMPKLSDALKETDKQGNVPLASHEALARDVAIRAGEQEGETHYGRIRRLNNEWNEQYPVHREHRVELTPWEKKPYNERALHHVQFGIPNGGGAMKTTPHDELRVSMQSYRNDDGSTGHYSKLEQVPEGHSLVEAVGKALGEHPMAADTRLLQQTGGEYPKDFNKPDRRAVAKEFGYDAAKQTSAEDPDPWSKKRQN
jgi:hypothetical protein